MSSDPLDLEALPSPPPTPIYTETARAAIHAVLPYLSGLTDLESLHPILWKDLRQRIMNHHDAIRASWPSRFDFDLDRLRDSDEIALQEWSRRFQRLFWATRTEHALDDLVGRMCTSVDYWTSPDASERHAPAELELAAKKELASLVSEIVDVLCGIFPADDTWQPSDPSTSG
jgi:hypothetical protein